MNKPRMLIVAGPPGAGKSSVFTLADLSDRIFNADDRAAELNGGSYQNIPLSVRAIVNREFEQYVHASIEVGRSFALETTLRSTITFEQAKLARASGFEIAMIYVALESVEHHIERVKRRAARGGHSASESTLRRIHANSLANLPLALGAASSVDLLTIYDNSDFEGRPHLVLESVNGKLVRLAEQFPEWLRSALHWSEEDLATRRAALHVPPQAR
jgi:predicted ABC-type ATPase